MKINKSAKDFLIRIQKRKTPTAQAVAGTLMDRKNVLDLNILVMLDVSGSISRHQFAQFMAQIDAIKGLSRVKVIEVDTKVVAFYDYFKTPQNRVARLRGGGGTAFAGAFKTAKKVKPDAILFMTDGEVSDNVSDPGIPVGWILTRGGRHPYGFGEVVVRLP